jgi:hypothetical protein
MENLENVGEKVLVYQTSRFQNKIKEEGGCLTTQNVLWKEK